MTPPRAKSQKSEFTFLQFSSFYSVGALSLQCTDCTRFREMQTCSGGRTCLISLSLGFLEVDLNSKLQLTTAPALGQAGGEDKCRELCCHNRDHRAHTPEWVLWQDLSNVQCLLTTPCSLCHICPGCDITSATPRAGCRGQGEARGQMEFISSPSLIV